MKLLHIDSSILGDASVSRTLSAAIVDHLATADADLEIEHHDLSARPLPHLSLPGLSEKAATAALEAFLAADIVVIGAPMYNFGIASHLKAWFDHIVIAGQTFQYGPEGVSGLAAGKRVILALSRGGQYSTGSAGAADELAERYLRTILAFIGIPSVETVVAEGLALGDEARVDAIKVALAQVGALPAARRPLA